jgi:hypothetical protein
MRFQIGPVYFETLDSSGCGTCIMYENPVENKTAAQIRSYGQQITNIPGVPF